MDIDNKNDRRNLVLLLHKEPKSRKDEKEIEILQKKYPDYNIFEAELEKELFERKFISQTDLTPDRPVVDENGDFVIHNFSPIITTESGLLAIKHKRFPSEYNEQLKKSKLRVLDITFKWVAVIGGVFGFINFLFTLLKG